MTYAEELFGLKGQVAVVIGGGGVLAGEIGRASCRERV